MELTLREDHTTTALTLEEHPEKGNLSRYAWEGVSCCTQRVLVSSYHLPLFTEQHKNHVQRWEACHK